MWKSWRPKETQQRFFKCWLKPRQIVKSMRCRVFPPDWGLQWVLGFHLPIPEIGLCATTECGQESLGSCCCHHQTFQDRRRRGWDHLSRPHPNLNHAERDHMRPATPLSCNWTLNAWTALHHEGQPSLAAVIRKSLAAVKYIKQSPSLSFGVGSTKSTAPWLPAIWGITLWT